MSPGVVSEGRSELVTSCLMWSIEFPFLYYTYGVTLAVNYQSVIIRCFNVICDHVPLPTNNTDYNSNAPYRKLVLLYCTSLT